PGLQHVQSFDDQDVGLIDDDLLAGYDIVGEVRINGCGDLAPAGLDVGKEQEKGGQIVALGKTLAVHKAFAFEDLIRQEEPIGGDEIDFRVVRQAGKQPLQDTCSGALSHRSAARR